MREVKVSFARVYSSVILRDAKLLGGTSLFSPPLLLENVGLEFADSRAGKGLKLRFIRLQVI